MGEKGQISCVSGNKSSPRNQFGVTSDRSGEHVPILLVVGTNRQE
jgi:hypothetical protein